MNTPLHVLVVDDETSIAYVFQRYLEWAGFRVTSAHDAATAYELSLLDPVDAIITDYRMPGMHGLDLIRRMRVDQPHLPAIIVTAYGNEIELDDIEAKVLQKPIDPRLVLACLQDQVGAATTPAGSETTESGMA